MLAPPKIEQDFVPLQIAARIGRPGVPLDQKQLQQTLFQPLRRSGKQPDIDGLIIRREDLAKAIATLREARVTFGDGRGSGT